MVDFNFHLEGIPDSPLAIAQRSAVIGPLLGDHRLETTKVIKTGVRQVQKVWRERIQLLTNTFHIYTPAKAQYMKNCPPAGVRMRADNDVRHSRVCKVHLICPWCWARLVVQRIWERVWETLQLPHLDMAYSEGRQEYPLDLVLCSRWESIGFDSGVNVASLLCLAQSLIHKATAVTDNVGAISLATLAPARTTYVLLVRTLVLARKDESIPSEEVRYDTPSPLNLAQLVGRMCRYPVGLLEEDGERVAEILRHRGKFRLLRILGAFNKNTPPPIQESEQFQRFLDL